MEYGDDNVKEGSTTRVDVIRHDDDATGSQVGEQEARIGTRHMPTRTAHDTTPTGGVAKDGEAAPGGSKRIPHSTTAMTSHALHSSASSGQTVAGV